VDANHFDPVGDAFDDGSVAAEAKKGKPGPKGPAGPAGPRGAVGPVATSFAAAGSQLAATIGATVTVDAECPALGAGTRILSGGFDTSVAGATSTDVRVDSATPVDANGSTPALYRVKFTRTDTAVNNPIVVIAFAICSP
jgi:hypothetical protein